MRGTDGDDTIDRELMRHQVETRTEPATDLADIRAQLIDARRRVGEAAREAGAAAVATGTAPFGAGDVRVSPKDRYRAMVDEFGETSREAGTCGMHVHVGIASREEGIGIIDRMRPWLPLVLALSVNSPYAEGRDSGYASWRSQVWCRWPTAGATELFGDPATYDALVADLMAAGAASDPGMVYFEARLAADWPTVEVRVADVCTDPDDAVVVAGVVRAIAVTAAAEWEAGTATAPLAQRAAEGGRLARREVRARRHPRAPGRARARARAAGAGVVRRTDATRPRGRRRPRGRHHRLRAAARRHGREPSASRLRAGWQHRGRGRRPGRPHRGGLGGLVNLLVGRTRGMFYLSHHPWVAVLVLVVLVLLVLYLKNQNQRR